MVGSRYISKPFFDSIEAKNDFNPENIKIGIAGHSTFPTIFFK